MHAHVSDAGRERGGRARRTDRDHLRRRLAAPHRADHQLRHRLRRAVPARLQADPADARGAPATDRQRVWPTPRRSAPSSPPSKTSGWRCSPRRTPTGNALIEEARAAAARLQAEETRQAIGGGRTDPASAPARPPSATAPRCSPNSDAKSDGSWSRRRRRHRQDSDGRRSPPAGRRDRAAARRCPGETAPRAAPPREAHDEQQADQARGAHAVPAVRDRRRRWTTRARATSRGGWRRRNAAGRCRSCRGFARLVRLEHDRRSALVESAAPLPDALRASVQADLARMYGPRVDRAVRSEPRAHRRHADQGRQRCLRRQRPRAAGGARMPAVTSRM